MAQISAPFQAVDGRFPFSDGLNLTKPSQWSRVRQQVHFFTSHHSGQRTFFGVRVALTTFACSSRDSRRSPSCSSGSFRLNRLEAGAVAP